MACVYKITRTDGLEYIGITINLYKRIKQHRKSNRFSMGISDVIVLSDNISYEEAEILEEKYINQFDTYKHGLNVTPNGKGLNEGCKFNTLGHKFSNKSKLKMSISAKKRGPTNKGIPCKEETKQKISLANKGKRPPNKKLNADIISDILISYKEDTIIFDNDFIRQFVKKSDHSKVGLGVPLVCKNGKALNRLTLYAHYYAIKLNVTPQLISKVIKNIENNGIYC